MNIDNLTNEQLVEQFAIACSNGNEYDNRDRITELQKELLRRLR